MEQSYTRSCDQPIIIVFFTLMHISAISSTWFKTNSWKMSSKEFSDPCRGQIDARAQEARSPGTLITSLSLTDLLSVRNEEILGLTVLLISFKQYDRGSRPNLGEVDPLEGEGVVGVEKGVSVEEEN